MSRFSRALAAVVSFALPILATPLFAQSVFPPQHADLLSASTYRALFGVSPTPAAPGAAVPEAGGPLPHVGTNVQVNDPQLAFPNGLLGRSETTLATNAGGLRIVVGWNDAEGFCGPPFNFGCPPPTTPGAIGYGVSTDGGRTFTDHGAPPTGTQIGFGPGTAGVSASGVFVTGTDPSLDAAGAGGAALYFASIGFFDDFAANTAGVAVHRGGFGPGSHFAWGEPVLLQSPGFPGDFLDKEHVEADGDSVYVTVTNFLKVAGIPAIGTGQIDAYRSQDGGATWARSVVQPDETLSPIAGTGVINQGSEPAVGTWGEVYAAWERGFLSPFFGQAAVGVWPEIRVSRSFDGGATWQPAAAGPPSTGVNPAGVQVAPICAGDLFPPSGYSRNRSNTFPRTAVARTGHHRGRVYVAWQDCRIANGGPMPAPLGPEDVAAGFGVDVGHPDTDVYLAYSDDRGATWSAPVLVAGGGDGRIQFWPTISVGAGGVVDLTWYESVEPNGTGFLNLGAGTSLVDVFAARSSDGGVSFGAPVRITEVTTDWGATASDLSPNFGDYNDAVTLGKKLLVTWADGRNGVPDVFFARAR
jgi:hypothetical protein